jgi:type IV secretion system protein TrbL
MDNLNVIDNFMQTFIRYIDSGFGLLSGDVGALTTILVGIDITLAGLFWAMEGDGNVLARLIKKVLYVGTFALILNNFSSLSMIVFNSFSTLGLHATQNSLTAADFLRPGKLASTGYQAAYPLLQQAGKLIGFTSFFNNVVTILVLVFAWIVVILSFFVVAVQLFITIIEFKLTTLAGFVLVPFALWGKTAFLAERVLGNVIASGIKVMVLAVIIGIGTTFFSTFITALQGHDPSLSDAMSLVLASLSLFGLSIFGPGIATGLVSGAPQLGAGAALGTAGALVGAGALAAGGAAGAARMAGGAGLGAVRAGTSLGAGAASAYQMAQASSGATGAAGVGAGLAGVARAGAGAVGNAARSAAGKMTSGLRESAQSGRESAFRATGGKTTGGAAANENAGSSSSAGSPPAWARKLRSEQRTRAHAHATSQAIKEGDRPGASANPDLDQKEN